MSNFTKEQSEKMEEMKKIIDELKQLKVKRIFLQFPEGLKPRIQSIVKELERGDFQVVMCLEPTYGSCDIREYEAELLKCDVILHIGHSDLGVKSKLPVIYWNYFYDVDPSTILKKEIEKLNGFKKIGLVTSLQFIKTMKKVEEHLKNMGKKVFVHKSLKYPGQVLGCDVSAAKKIEDKVDCFLCITAGKFYGLGLALSTDKPVLSLDLERGEIYNSNELKKKVQKIIAWNKNQLKESKKIGILVSWKKGQLKSPFDLKKKLEKEGKEVYILTMDEISSEKMEGLKLDYLINLACPRIGIDDLERYKIPVLNFNFI